MRTLGWIYLLFIFLPACKKDEVGQNNQNIKYGKNRFTTKIDGDEREYYVYVPAKYDGKQAVPMVFMLHGTSGDGEKFYNSSGWKEVGETNHILTVFPSSWRYCIISDGERANTTKWSSQPAEWVPCEGLVLRDDVKFLRTIIDEMTARYNVDRKRVYLAGFSNGGQMAAKCTIEMGDVFAAIVESAGSFYLDTTYRPVRKMPVTFQIGNEDYGPGNEGPAIPLINLDTLLTSPEINLRNGKYYLTSQTHIKSFMLNPVFTITGDTTKAVIAHYQPLNTAERHQFRFILIKDLKHAYSNGENHPYKAAEENWAWMKQFILP